MYVYIYIYIYIGFKISGLKVLGFVSLVGCN